MDAETNRPETIRIATYCAENAIEARRRGGMFGSAAFALSSARNEFGETRHPYAAGGFDTDLARATIAAVFAAA